MANLRQNLTREVLEPLWGKISLNSIARRLGERADKVHRIGREYGLPRYPRKPQKQVDPTAEEIEERAAAIRETWTEEETERRYLGPKGSGPWKTPVFRVGVSGGILVMEKSSE